MDADDNSAAEAGMGWIQQGDQNRQRLHLLIAGALSGSEQDDPENEQELSGILATTIDAYRRGTHLIRQGANASQDSQDVLRSADASRNFSGLLGALVRNGLHEAVGEAEVSLAGYERLLEVDPSNEAALEGKASITMLLSSYQPRIAISLLDDAVKTLRGAPKSKEKGTLDVSLATALCELGRNYERFGNFDQAIECFTEGLEALGQLVADSSLQRRLLAGDLHAALGELYLRQYATETADSHIRSAINWYQSANASFPSFVAGFKWARGLGLLATLQIDCRSGAAPATLRSEMSVYDSIDSPSEIPTVNYSRAVALLRLARILKDSEAAQSLRLLDDAGMFLAKAVDSPEGEKVRDSLVREVTKLTAELRLDQGKV